jgi:hypothetical protein
LANNKFPNKKNEDRKMKALLFIISLIATQSVFADDFDRNMQAIRDQGDRRGAEAQIQAQQQVIELRQQAEINQIRAQQQFQQDQINYSISRQRSSGD